MADKENKRVKLEFDDVGLASILFGPQNSNLDLLSRQSGVRVESKGNTLLLLAESEELIDPVAKSFNQLYSLLKSGKEVYPQDVEAAYRILCRDPGADLIKIFRDELFAVSPKKRLHHVRLLSGLIFLQSVITTWFLP